ncbi:MAG TPA: FadR/GntR family transcriptional regulator [Gaiella sp.]|jgi:GntR family transcriptional repressor for pyruvate dehydrogenase complex
MDREIALSDPPLGALPFSRRAHEFVAHELLVLILSGQFAAGDRLPPERTLAAEFGVSRPTVRQAVSVLAARGLVESRVGSGTFVVGVPDVAAAEAGASLAEIMEARLVFEVGAVRLAARRAQRSREDIDFLSAVVEALERADDRDAFPVETDIAFHRAVVDLTGNDHLRELVAPCWQATAATVAASARDTWTAEDTARMAAQHRAVFEALRVGDAELAGFEMERHLRSELARLINAGSSEGPPSRFFA